MYIPIKATSDGVGYASKTPYEWDGKQFEPDIQNGDLVTIKDEGSSENGQYGEQTYFKIETRNGIKKAPFNQSSLNVLAGAWGQESTKWVDKQVRVLTQKAIIGGERKIKAFFVLDGWYIDDWGDLVKDEPIAKGHPNVAGRSPATPMPDAYHDARNQSAGDIPFGDENEVDPTEANVPA